MPDSSNENIATGMGPEDEINRLRAQVRQLQAQLSQRTADVPPGPSPRSRTASEEASDLARDLPGRFTEQASKFVRASTFACLEQVRQTADVMAAFTEEVFRDNVPERHATRRAETDTASAEASSSRRPQTNMRLTQNLPCDIYNAMVRAMDRFIDIPNAAMDRFRDTCHEADAAARRESAPPRAKSKPPEAFDPATLV